MKTILCISLLTILIFSNCTDSYVAEEDKIINALESEKFPLRKLLIKSSQESHVSGSYFLIVGSMSGSSKEVTKIKFYFLDWSGTYQFHETYLPNVYVKIDNTVDIPYVKFKFKGYCYPYSIIKYGGHDLHVKKIILTCNESQFTPEFNMNLN